jgi:hypothetical protein
LKGTIVWERWQFEEFLQSRKRVCHVTNICWADGRLTMCPRQTTNHKPQTTNHKP